MAVKTLLLDLDGVFCDFCYIIAPFLGLPRDFQPTTWQWKDVGISDERFAKAWKEFMATENIWTTPPPLPAMTELFEAMKNGLTEKTDVVFLTSRGRSKGDSPTEQSRRWLRKHLGIGLAAHVSVIAVSDAAHKQALVTALDEPAILDDFAPTIVMAGKKRGTLYRQSWNRSEETAYNLPAVDTFGEFLERCGLGGFVK